MPRRDGGHEFGRGGDRSTGGAHDELARLRMRLTAAQLRPHFLLNALHSIGVLLRTGRPDRALEAVNRAGDLLRHVVQATDRDSMTLAEEVAFVRAYLRMEALRLESEPALQVEMGADAAGAFVPGMMLQPLVENCLRHGARGAGDRLGIRIEARRLGGLLRVRVVDDGRGLPPEWDLETAGGTGLLAVRERIRAAAGSEARMEVANHPGGGVVVEIRMPFHRHEGLVGEGGGGRARVAGWPGG